MFNLYKAFLFIVVSALTVGCDQKDSARTTASTEIIKDQGKDLAALTKDAKATVKALGGALQTELKAALTEGGPLAAMDVCQIKAPELSTTVSLANNTTVKRVSLKPRNAELGVANSWQTQILEDFAARNAAGEDHASLVYSEIVDSQYRFMQAIPTAPACLMCHGSNISPNVSEKLAELYPQDQATGYAEGDLRGAFLVIKDLAH